MTTGFIGMRLNKTFTPVVAIWFCVFAMVLASNFSEDKFQITGELFASLAFPLVLTGWLLSDARRRGRQLCYDFDTFIFFAWPILLPVYLFQTRGWRAFLTLLYFGSIWGLAIIFSFGLSLLQE
jgi:hypothetical protein